MSYDRWILSDDKVALTIPISETEVTESLFNLNFSIEFVWNRIALTTALRIIYKCNITTLQRAITFYTKSIVYEWFAKNYKAQKLMFVFTFSANVSKRRLADTIMECVPFLFTSKWRCYIYQCNGHQNIDYDQRKHDSIIMHVPSCQNHSKSVLEI